MYNLGALYSKCRELQLILSVTVSVVFSATIVINCLLRVFILQCSAIIKWGGFLSTPANSVQTWWKFCLCVCVRTRVLVRSGFILLWMLTAAALFPRFSRVEFSSNKLINLQTVIVSQILFWVLSNISSDANDFDPIRIKQRILLCFKGKSVSTESRQWTYSVIPLFYYPFFQSPPHHHSLNSFTHLLTCLTSALSSSLLCHVQTSLFLKGELPVGGKSRCFGTMAPD